MELPVDPPLHPRLDRARRGRPDPPADRAARLAAGDAAPRRDPPRRRQRGRRGLAARDRPHPQPGRAGPHPPDRAGLRPLQVRLRRGGAARRLRARRRRGRRPGADPDRHRQRGPAGARRPRDADRRGHPLARRQPALLGALRPPGRRATATRCCRRRHRPGRDRGGLDAGLGALRRHRRRDHRHDHLRPVGAVRGRRGGVRVHRRTRSPRWRARSPSARPTTHPRPEEVAR